MSVIDDYKVKVAEAIRNVNAYKSTPPSVLQNLLIGLADLIEGIGGGSGDSTSNNDNISGIKVANYTATAQDGTILVDCSGGSITITITQIALKKYNIKKIDSSLNSLVVVPATGLLEFTTSRVLLNRGDSIQTHSNGTNTYII